ncbi:methylmalonyl-CoA mutase [Streptomyces sp. NPDC091267]|uniref:cobalamin B12-binding domain-containing protein n=1 Tax=unclassified Streptomyces TaxID=2593676 RepID=UPI00343E108B
MNGIAAVRGKRIIVSGVSSDAHTWNLVFLQLLLEGQGHEVANLGSLAPDALIIDACRTQRPDLLVISSVNGHGQLDGMRLIRALRAVPGLGGLPAVIGGKLGIHGRDNVRFGDRLTAAGYDAVFDDGEAGTLERFEAFVHGLGTRSVVPGAAAAGEEAA